MTITKEAFVDLQEKYNKVMKLLEEDSKLDPETEPFLSKYSARQILIGMKANIENLIRNQSVDGQDNIKLTGKIDMNNPFTNININNKIQFPLPYNS